MGAALTADAIERSTYAITITFYDEEDNLVDPLTAKWTLTDADGSVINNREEVAITSPSSSETIVLQGDDLVLQGGESGSGERVFTVEATYDSSLGSGLPLNDFTTFRVLGLVAVGVAA